MCCLFEMVSLKGEQNHVNEIEKRGNEGKLSSQH